MNALLPDTDSEDELPENWERKISLTNKVYYLNLRTNRTQWTHPISGKRRAVKSQFSNGWKREFDVQTLTAFFRNTITGQSTFTDPRLASAYEMNNFPVSKMSDFGPKSTADDVLEHFDIESKVAIVTGSNCGIGFEIARALALKKVHVIMGCRNHFKAMEAIKKIQAIENVISQI